MSDVGQTVLENLAGGRTSAAVPATVISVEDPTCFIPHDVTALRLTPAGHGSLPRVLPLQRLTSDEFSLTRSTWGGGNVLYLAPLLRSYAVYVRWTPEWQFRGWYVNIQSPMTIGADRWITEDLFLDVVVQPDGRWALKDEVELSDAVVVGRLTEDAAGAVRGVAAEIVSQVEHRDWPFCPSVATWRPDPCWRRPVIPPHWQARD